MGVAGAGKSTLAAALAAHWGIPFLDADDLHSPTARSKMAAGDPLNDADRAPWLAAINARLCAAPGPVALACSALTARYREALCAGLDPPPRFIWLDGARAELVERLHRRQGHFFPPALLDSQLALLEPDPAALRLPLTLPMPDAVAAVAAWLAQA